MGNRAWTRAAARPTNQDKTVTNRLVSPMRELERSSLRHTDDAGPPVGALAIVGAGRVGGSLAAAARAAGFEVRLAARGEATGASAGAEAALICVADADIAAAAAEVGAARPAPRLVGHVSGATSLDALDPAVDADGTVAFALHPLQTIPGDDAELAGCPCAVAGADATALAYATALAERLGMRPFTLDEDARAAYHAAASMASNLLVALEESAVELLSAAGIADGRELLSPLVLRSAANWSEHGAAALTGPIARGDEATVRAHREALRERAPELLDAYEALAERARAIAAPREAGR